MDVYNLELSEEQLRQYEQELARAEAAELYDDDDL
jgi:hypothetical protein